MIRVQSNRVLLECHVVNDENVRASISRRGFLQQAGIAAAIAMGAPLTAAEPDRKRFVIDTHMHIWSGDLEKFPFRDSVTRAPVVDPNKTAGTVELLLKEMEEFGVTHCVLVQALFHGWDNAYVAHCLKQHPKRFRAHGLIDPTDPRVADKLEFWMREHHFSGMRFSPIYYIGKDDWMTSAAHDELWKKADKLGAVFNFFISTPQLPKLEVMVARYPGVRVVIDHLARVDLKQADPLQEFQKLLKLAKYPRVYVKVSELSLLSPSKKFPYADTFAWVRRMYDAFGPERLLWGTGFPGITRDEYGRPGLRQELDLIEKEIPFFTAEDRANILGGNATKLWGFEAA